MSAPLVSHEEYAVEVVGRGYIGFAGELRKNPDFTQIDDPATALRILQATMNKYTAMGCPEVAATCRLVKRTLTLTRGAWEPIDFPKTIGAESSTANPSEIGNQQ